MNNTNKKAHACGARRLDSSQLFLSVIVPDFNVYRNVVLYANTKNTNKETLTLVVPGALIVANCFFRLLSQNSMCPAMFPNPPRIMNRP